MSKSNILILVEAIQTVTQKYEFQNCLVVQLSLMKVMCGTYVFQTEIKSQQKYIKTQFFKNKHENRTIYVICKLHIWLETGNDERSFSEIV